MASTRPARATKENDTPTKADASEVPAKRGRGRPPKNGVSAQPKKVYEPTGRPRGRPPGTGRGVKKAAAKKAAPTNSTGRGRGRPPANKTESATTTPKKAGATTKVSSAKSKTKSTGKAGRPRKSDVAAEQSEDNNEELEDEEQGTTSVHMNPGFWQRVL